MATTGSSGKWTDFFRFCACYFVCLSFELRSYYSGLAIVVRDRRAMSRGDSWLVAMWFGLRTFWAAFPWPSFLSLRSVDPSFFFLGTCLGYYFCDLLAFLLLGEDYVTNRFCFSSSSLWTPWRRDGMTWEGFTADFEFDYSVVRFFNGLSPLQLR